MSINRFSDYDTTQSYGDYQTLPKGAYVMEIKGAVVCENSRGQYVKVQCDVAEGEFQGFFGRDYEYQQTKDKKWHCYYLLSVPIDDGTKEDGWTKRKFKTFAEALEESNPGYVFDWDEAGFTGLLIGGLFNEREYKKNDGSVGMAINFAQVTSVNKVRTGDYIIPKDKLLKKTSEESEKTEESGKTDESQNNGGWIENAQEASADLPFK